MIARLGVFTVKSVHAWNGRWYTYGGFGAYLSEIRKYAHVTVLVAHVRHAPPREGDYEIPNNNLEVRELPPIKNELESLLTLPIQFLRCYRAARTLTIAHARMPDYTGVVGALACKLHGIPYFCQIVDDWDLLAQKTRWSKRLGLGLLMKLHFFVYGRMERFVCRNALVFAQGRTCFEKHRWSAKCNLVVSSSHRRADISFSRPIRSPGQRVLLNVGRLNSVKNQELLIQALAKLNSRGKSWRLIIAGTGSRKRALELEADRLGVSDELTFIGQIKHGDALWQHYDHADVFALSSRSEGTPKVVLEAFARGTPVVAANVAGVPDLLGDGSRGLLFDDNDVEGLVAAVQRLTEDSELRSRVVANAYDFAMENTVEEQTRKMMESVHLEYPLICGGFKS